MNDQQKIAEFSAEKQRFFNALSPAKLRSIAQANNRVKYRYDVAMMSNDGSELQKNKLYIELFEGRLRYTFKGFGDRKVIGEIDMAELNQGVNPPIVFNDPLTLEQLKPVLPNFLRITAKRGHNGFHFAAEYREMIEQEVSDLFASLKVNGQNRDEFWRLCYFWCQTLEDYYNERSDEGAAPLDFTKAKKYRELRKKIEYKCQTGHFPPQADAEGLTVSLVEQLQNSLSDLMDTVQHTSLIRGWLGFVNFYRILFLFSRFAVKNGLLLIHQLKWLDSLSQLLNKNIDLNALISMINAPASIFNFLSVAIFEIRLFIMLCEVLKHVLAPTEKEASLTMQERFSQEFVTRLLDLYNDIAWGAVNLLCNYGYLADPVANLVTGAFLLLDALALMCSLYLTYQQYALKKAQYEYELTLLTSVDAGNLQREMLQSQLHQLEIDWGAKRDQTVFFAIAALILAGGFSISLLLVSPIAITTCFLSCTIGVSMYLSAEKYGNYVRATLSVQNNGDIAGLAEADKAYGIFLTSLAKNTVMPLVMVTAFAVYWPAALLLAIAYIAYEKSGKTEPQPLPEWQPQIGTKAEAEEREERFDIDQGFLFAP